MGSFRRRLITIACCLPTTSAAEVCDKQRPLWSPEDGTATAVDELIAVITSSVGLALIALTLIAMLAGRRWLKIMSSGLWGLMTLGQLASFYTDGVHLGAIQEGCIGPIYLSIGVCAAICILMAWASRRRAKKGV